MFTSIDDVEDPIYLIDHPPPLNYFEFDSSILQWSNLEPVISPPNINSLVLSNGDMKATGKKTKGDRHRKIPTANGLRDRRMRLSLDVARQFFKLQDMLSFDKPSKTVKWLLSQAKSAIEEVDKGEKGSFFDVAKSSSSCVSEGEVVENAIDDREIVKVAGSKEKRDKKRKKESRLVEKQDRKKLREEARERARERTQKKKIYDGLGMIRDEESQHCNVFEIDHEIQNGRNAFGTSMDFGSNWSSLNPNPEFQPFDGASGVFYSHPIEGHQYWNY